MKKIVVLIIFLMLLGSISFFVFNSDYFKLKIVDIFGDQEISEFEILEYSKIKKNTNLLFIDVNMVKENLERHPMIKTATVEKIYPDRITIDYTVRKAILSIYYSNYFINIDQNHYALSANQNEAGLMAIYGLEVENFNLGNKIQVFNESIMESSIELVQLIKISDLNFLPSIQIEDNKILLKIYSDFYVNFGDGKNIENRFNAFYNIYLDLIKSDIAKGVIDVSTDGLPLYKPFN
ncbi:MAG: FtsQ-type POTRA domain-containing protein [Clostridiales bacterium]|nr:FtsQ-type POTRA domain-containing protein [Clostridiales bacterium]